MTAPKVRYGGSFAPPLSDDRLARYAELVESTDPETPLGDYARQLLELAEAWWELPESTKKGAPHPVGEMVGRDGRRYAAPLEVPLEEPHREELWGLIPWRPEMDRMGEVFDAIDPVAQKELRDCCFHLLWHARELDRDREPITQDKLKEIR